MIKSRSSAFTPAQVTKALTHSSLFHPRGGRSDGSGCGTADATGVLGLAAQIQAAPPPAAPPPATPSSRNTSAAVAAPPTIAAAGLTLGSSLLDDAVFLFLVVLAV